MSEKLLLFCFSSSSSHPNDLLLPCNPSRLDSTETKKGAEMTADSQRWHGLRGRIRASGDQSLMGSESGEQSHLLRLQWSEAPSEVWPSVSGLITRAEMGL